MTRYNNSNVTSGVDSYEIGTDYIKVKFKDGCVYTYTYSVTGKDHVEAMKKLARQGYGLNSYINKNKLKFSNKICP